MMRQYGDGTDTDAGAMATNVEETEETLPDGTVVKRRVVTTEERQLTTERVVLEPDDEWSGSRIIDDEDDHRASPVFDYSNTGLYIHYSVIGVI